MFGSMKKSLLFFLVFELIVLTLIVYLAPPVCDRWMETVTPWQVGDLCRYLWSLTYWFFNVSTRILSNLFSFLIDKNFFSRAICNGIMLTLISVCGIKFSGADKAKNKVIICVFSFCCLLFVSWGIQQEVYFYASTLYVSSTLISLAVLWLDVLLARNSATKTQRYFLYVFIIAGMLWIETNIIQIIIGTSMVWLIRCIEKKEIDKITLLPMLVSIICTIVFGCANAIIKNGKLQANKDKIHFNKYAIIDLVNNNSLIFIVLSVIVLLIMYIHFIKDKRLKLAIIQTPVWIIMLMNGIVVYSRHIFSMLINAPEDYVQGVYGWYNIKNDYFDKCYNLYSVVFDNIIFICSMLAMISLIWILWKLGKGLLGIPLIFMGASVTIIPIVGLFAGDRITSSFVFMLIVLICVLLNVLLEEDVSYKIVKGMLLFVCALAFISLESIFSFLHLQRNVANKRENIANEIRERQEMGEWDYDFFVIMPRYDSVGDGKRMIGEERTNPTNIDVYYPFLLRYYDLNQGTKILFSNSDFQLIEVISADESEAYMYAHTLRNYNSVQYQFIITDGNNNILEDSGWVDQNKWSISPDYVKQTKVIYQYKCNIKIGNEMINIVNSGVVWKEAE